MRRERDALKLEADQLRTQLQAFQQDPSECESPKLLEKPIDQVKRDEYSAKVLKWAESANMKDHRQVKRLLVFFVLCPRGFFHERDEESGLSYLSDFFAMLCIQKVFRRLIFSLVKHKQTIQKSVEAKF